MSDSTDLERERRNYRLRLPRIFTELSKLKSVEKEPIPLKNDPDKLKETFPAGHKLPIVKFETHEEETEHPLLRIGVVFSGGQAAGGHNVICGLFDALKVLNPESRLYGFLNGPIGIVQGDARELTEELLEPYRNEGGFDLIGSGRDKIEKEEQFLAVEKTVGEFDLNGLVIIGGDDSNTNASILAEHFEKNKIECRVVGVPKTIDGDLKNEWIETSFGFDTATKRFSESIGDICRDALSAGKYYFFIKLMGRSASHIALECALKTHPNMTLIGEEIFESKKSLRDVVSEVTDMIAERAQQGKNYGVVLIPEGVIEFIPEIKALIKELNHLLSTNEEVANQLKEIHLSEARVEFIARRLSEEAEACYINLPMEIQEQMIKERDPHGNVKVSKIETERLILTMVQEQIKKRGDFQGKFSAQPLFFGYEGRSSFPSNFDANYCYALGHVAALLLEDKKTGYISSIQNLSSPIEEWEPAGIPLVPMMAIEERKGKRKPVIKKALVELDGAPFRYFKERRDAWKMEDDYRYPGPIQYFGPEEITDSVPILLTLEKQKAEV